jgi:hypothetical protein
MIYGKLYKKLYSGSMVGSGPEVFAVMGYVIANMEPDKVYGERVTLNPAIIAAAIGKTSIDAMQSAIDFLASPDVKTSTPGDDGRRIVMIEPFIYRVVNGRMYRKIRDQQEMREASAMRQATFRARKRARKRKGAGPTLAERNAEKQGLESVDARPDEILPNGATVPKYPTREHEAWK